MPPASAAPFAGLVRSPWLDSRHPGRCGTSTAREGNFAAAESRRTAVRTKGCPPPAPTSATFAGRQHCCAMVKSHPHAGATYEIVPLEDRTYQVNVTIPAGRRRATITGLSTRVDAKRWIEEHQAAIDGGAPDSHSQAPPSKPK